MNESDNPAYTFATFVAGDCTASALAAARAVSAAPARAHNPLFLLGPSGSGKSHLLHAIAHELRASQPRGTVVRMSGEKLLMAMCEAIRIHEMPAFRARVSTFRAVLIDDFAVDARKPNTEIELFLWLQAGIDAGAQLVVAFSGSRAELESLSGRHETFFSRALIVETGYPSPEARRELATRAADALGAPHETADYVAERLTGSAAEIRAVMMRVAAESLLAAHQPVDLTRVARICDMVAGPR